MWLLARPLSSLQVAAETKTRKDGTIGTRAKRSPWFCVSVGGFLWVVGYIWVKCFHCACPSCGSGHDDSHVNHELSESPRPTAPPSSPSQPAEEGETPETAPPSHSAQDPHEGGTKSSPAIASAGLDPYTTQRNEQVGR